MVTDMPLQTMTCRYCDRWNGNPEGVDCEAPYGADAEGIARWHASAACVEAAAPLDTKSAANYRTLHDLDQFLDARRVEARRGGREPSYSRGGPA